MAIETVFAVLSGGAGAFAGLSKALSNFNQRIEKRFQSLESDFSSFQDRVIRDYVLKEDFLREMQAVHNKLDRILDHLLTLNQK